MRTRLRLLAALLSALLIASGLSACRSNVGSAAYVGDYRISEKTISSFLTAQSKVYSDTTSTGTQTVIPKNLVLQLLIQARVFDTALARNGGAPGPGELTKARTTLLANTTEASVRAQFTQHGFTPSFEPMLVRTYTLNQVFQTRYTTTAVKARVFKELQAISKTVRVSPRYGVWDQANFSLGTAPNPGFLRLNAPKPSAV